MRNRAHRLCPLLFVGVSLGLSASEPSDPSGEVIEEEIEVQAPATSGRVSPLGVATTRIEVEGGRGGSDALELITEEPGVAANGQGGLFQVYSIRGVSRQRVLTLVGGVQVHGERRAGVSASFIDPELLGAVEVVRGAASTTYGSGALGGVVELIPSRFRSWQLASGYESGTDERFLRVSGGSESVSAGLAWRRSEDYESPDGARQNSHFDQLSGTLQGRGAWGETSWVLALSASRGRDIGKANRRYPERRTDYPSEAHVLARFDLVHEAWGDLGIWLHLNDLETRDTRAGERALVENEAFDFGGQWSRDWARGPWWGRVGLDTLWRTGVTSHERAWDVAADGRERLVREELTLDDARRRDSALWAMAGRGWKRLTLQFGARATRSEQANRDQRRDQDAWSGFLGGLWAWGSGWETSLQVSSGLRFPSLSERFFTGTTGRGQVVGNPDLEAERSLTFELGLRRHGPETTWSAFAFRTEVDDYIERIEVAPETLSFVNLDSGHLEGLELDWTWRPGPEWSWGLRGSRIRGRTDEGGFLADVPSDRLAARVTWTTSPRQSVSARLEHRFDKDDPGSGEEALTSADLLEASWSYRLGSAWELGIWGENLLDEAYYSAADDLAPLAAARRFGVQLRWSPRDDA